MTASKGGDGDGTNSGIGRGHQPLQRLDRTIAHLAQRPDEAMLDIALRLVPEGGIDRGNGVRIMDIEQRPRDSEPHIGVGIAQRLQQSNGGMVRTAIPDSPGRNLPDLSPREWALMVPTVALAIFMGIAPGFFLKPMEPSVIRTLDRINEVKPAAAWLPPGIEDRGSRIGKHEPRISNRDPRKLVVAR